MFDEVNQLDATEDRSRRDDSHRCLVVPLGLARRIQARNADVAPCSTGRLRIRRERAAEGVRFAILGDFNRRLGMPNDTVWADWDDASPANADLALASGDQSARCNPRYRDFIDFIVLDRRATEDLRGFDEKTFEGEGLSDHCAVSASLSLR